MSHQPLALKYRPATFADVISQEHVTRTLQNALNQNRPAHAYLFAGPRGSGKTSTARLLAKALNCDQGVSGDPCGECDNCVGVASGRSLDVIEIDAASNRGIDDIKELRETVKYAPAQGRYKVYIVDEVHQLSKDAFNAFLKTLEEPPPNVVFVLATTEAHKILPTILSRCQRFDFRPIPLPAIRERLAMIAENEAIDLDDQAAFAIAKKADGSLRDALSLLDQVVAFGGELIDLESLRRLIGMPEEERYLDLTNVLLEGDAKAALAFVQELRSGGYDLEEFYSGLLEHLRDCLLFAIGQTELAEVPERYHDSYRETVEGVDAEDLIRMLTLATDEEQVFRRSSQQGLVLEILLVRLALLDRTVDIDQLLGAARSKRTASGGSGSGGGDGSAPPKSERTGPQTSTPAPKATEPAPPATQPAPQAGEPPPEKSEPRKKDGPLTLDLLADQWDELLEVLHGARPTLAALLKGARPCSCGSDEVTLTVSADAEFRREQLTSRGVLDPLKDVLKDKWAFRGDIQVVEEGTVEPAKASTKREVDVRAAEARDLKARLESDPVLRQAVDLFGANVVRIQKSSPARP